MRIQPERFQAQPHHACGMAPYQRKLASACQLCHVACVMFKGCTGLCYLWGGVRTYTVRHFHIPVLWNASSLQTDPQTWRISLGVTREDICIQAGAHNGHTPVFRRTPALTHYMRRSTDVHICIGAHLHLQEHTPAWVASSNTRGSVSGYGLCEAN